MFPCVRPLGLRDLLRSAFHDNTSTLASAFRTEVDDPVCCLYDMEVVFNHDDRVSKVNQAVQNA